MFALIILFYSELLSSCEKYKEKVIRAVHDIICLLSSVNS